MNSELIKIFDRLCYGKQPSNVFSDLLTVTIAQFCPPPHYQTEHSEAVKRLEKKDLINQFVFSLVKEYQSGIEHSGWCDPWGDLYMELSSKYKAQAMGQYFSPDSICTFMAQLTHGMDEHKPGKTFHDPACGSGRMLLAVKSIFPESYFFAADLDHICCKMTAVNFAFHGCIGEVVQHNTLTDPNGLIQGWKVANIGLPIPAILPMTKEESYICSGNTWFDVYGGIEALLSSIKAVETIQQEPEPEPVREVPVRLEPVFDKVIEKVEQMELSLF